jgi:hypothetical protein
MSRSVLIQDGGKRMTPKMEMELRELGILLPTEDQCGQENELVRYDLSYKMPELDEYGEPPW